MASLTLWQSLVYPCPHHLAILLHSYFLFSSISFIAPLSRLLLIAPLPLILSLQCFSFLSFVWTNDFTEYGDLYAWGRGREGQLGHGTRDNSAEPRAVEKLAHERIIRAQCGHSHTIALTGMSSSLSLSPIDPFVGSFSPFFRAAHLTILFRYG